MPLLLVALIFIVLFGTILLFLGLCAAINRRKQNNQIRAMLRTADPIVAERAVDLLRPASIETSVEKILRQMGVANRLDLFLDQAGMDWNSTKLVLISVGLGFASFVVGSQLPYFPYRFVFSLILAVACGCLPLLIVSRKRAKRLHQFEEQFPEALDFLGRSMRAGHAFSVGLEMLVAECPDPLASIFRRALQDLHLGSPLDEALGKIVTLVPIVDVRFFVSSVLLQQETGGNLSEILSKLAQVIRDRFRLKGQVKAVSAHGRITGLVLVLMPVGLGVVMLITSPGYLLTLFVDPTGKKMIMGAVLAQMLGFLCIRKITRIKV